MSSVLTASSLTKSFRDIRAVRDVSFEIGAGEIYGLLGPNGAGKTTTIAMVCGLLSPDEGCVAIDGQDYAADAVSARKKMGVVPQELAVYEELSAEQNLRFWGRLAGLSREVARRRSAEILEELSLTDRAKDAVRTYSGGMKRRVNIGCALLHEPKLLLLDEPTVGIDPQARARILELVRALAKRGTGVLYTTHYLDEAEQLCDRVGIIDNGSLLAEGTLAELQDRLGGERLFILEGDFSDVDPVAWSDFDKSFRILHQQSGRLVIASLVDRHPSESLKELLDLPIEVDNATVKRPSLNDVFLQLTGRELRE